MSAPGPAAADAVAGDAAGAGAGPPPAPAPSVAAGGVSAGSVFVKRSDDALARFAEVEIFEADNVARLAERASLKLVWRTTAAYVDLFLIKPAGGEHAFTTPTQAQIDAVLANEGSVLGEGMPLSLASITSGAWVVARLPSLPAAAHGECARARGSQPPFALAEQGGRRCSRDMRAIPLGSLLGAHAFSVLASLSLPSQAAVAAALGARLTETSWRG